MSSSQAGKNVSKPTAVDMGANTAKLREALVHCRNCAQMIPPFVQASKPGRSSLNAAADYANLILLHVDAALAAPPRNCDVATEEEAVESFRRTIPAKGLSDDEREIVKVCIDDIVGTLYAPYKEGSAK